MAPYILLYDIEEDAFFQCEIDEGSARKARAAGPFSNSVIDIRETPFPNIKIRSRYRSVRMRSLPDATY